MFKRLMLSLALAFAPMVALPLLVLPGTAVAANCFNTSPIPGEIRYDPGDNTCPRAVVNADGSLKTNGGSSTNPNANPATFYSGRLTVSTSAISLSTLSPTPPAALVNGLVCTALIGNSGIIDIGVVGVTSGAGYPLPAGFSWSSGYTTLANGYVIGTLAGDVLACTGN